MKNSKLTGAWGEALAAEYLRKKRYRIEAAGYFCRFGEIDLIASDKHYLVFVILAILACVPWKTVAGHLPERVKTMGGALKPLAITVLFLLALSMIVTQSYNPFLYFRF